LTEGNCPLKRIINPAILFLLIFFLSSAYAGPNDWLLGNWIHSYNPDGNAQDVLTFAGEGKFVSTELASGNTQEGIYFVKADYVQVYLVQKGKIVMKLKLSYDTRKDKLYFYSEKTGNTSYYTKHK
jgi:hypothetical protein